MTDTYPNFPKEKWLQDIYLYAYWYTYAYTKTLLALKGGQGSGNFNHAGRIGLVGGSQASGEYYTEKPFLRYARSGNPMSDWGHAMFANHKDGYFDRLPKGYSAYQFNPRKDDSRVVYSGELEDKIWAEFEKDLSNGYWNGDINSDFQQFIDSYNNNEITKDDFLGYFSPINIVNSAEAYDSILSGWLWERVLEPNGYMAVITPDGAVVFDESLIEEYAG